MKVLPARLEPRFMPRIWGARWLSPLFPGAAAPAEPIGEVWLTGHDCRFADGPFTGRTLGDAWREMDEEWVGSRIGRDGPFPILVKFIFPEDKLSVQVHPDDEYARRKESATGVQGKTEMWYVVSARPGAEILLGLNPHVTLDAFRRAIAAGTVEECLERCPVCDGDAIFVPAGTVHSIGPGVVLCEIQEHSDITYRIFDYNRLTAEGLPRALHVEKALEVIRFGERIGGKLEPVRITRKPVTETFFIACRYFATEKWEFAERIAAVTRRERFELLITIAGSGRIHWSDSSAAFAPGQVWLLPAALGAYHLAPESATTLLRTYVPDVNEFVRRLADQHVEEEVWSRLVYP